MFTLNNTKTVTDLRENTLSLLDDINKLKTAYIFHHSKPRAVMLSLDKYQQLLEALETKRDEELAQKLAGEPKEAGATLEELAAEYDISL